MWSSNTGIANFDGGGVHKTSELIMRGLLTHIHTHTCSQLICAINPLVQLNYLTLLKTCSGTLTTSKPPAFGSMCQCVVHTCIIYK